MISPPKVSRSNSPQASLSPILKNRLIKNNYLFIYSFIQYMAQWSGEKACPANDGTSSP